jgi:hypothetical protein
MEPGTYSRPSPIFLLASWARIWSTVDSGVPGNNLIGPIESSAQYTFWLYQPTDCCLKLQSVLGVREEQNAQGGFSVFYVMVEIYWGFILIQRLLKNVPQAFYSLP